MQMIPRRAAILGIGAAAGATVAAGLLLRKRRPEIATPLAPPPVGLQALSAMARTDPPAIPADAPILDAAGVAHHLAAFAGRGVVLNMWATWCVPCVAELPALAALARRLPADDLAVLAVSSDRGGVETVRRFYDSHAITGLAIWLDPHGDAARAWGARGIPTTLILDRQGRERGRLEGAADWSSDAALAAIRAMVG